MAQLEHIEAIEKRLWNAADTLRANSNYASNEYFLPVMGLIFLRHAYSRFLGVKDVIKANLPKRGSKTRALTKEDFSQKSGIFLQPKAQFDYLVALTDSDDRAKAIIEAMEAIEVDYDNLRGVLPKSEYQKLDNAVLGQLLRRLNPDELKKVSGAIFDLLKKQDLSPSDIKRIKAVPVGLLERLKAEKLRVDHWRDKESTRDAVRITIRDFLWSDETGLPIDAYDENKVNVKAEEVFVHVFRAYPTVPSPYYATVAS
jgi:hypothetical protein